MSRAALVKDAGLTFVDPVDPLEYFKNMLSPRLGVVSFPLVGQETAMHVINVDHSKNLAVNITATTLMRLYYPASTSIIRGLALVTGTNTRNYQQDMPVSMRTRLRIIHKEVVARVDTVSTS